MSTTKQIIAALARLEAAREKLEVKEWLATRKNLGADMDPDQVDVCCEYAQVLDPYNVCPSFPKELDQIGREYFARTSKAAVWVSFDDLPNTTVDRLWQRMRAGDFDKPISAADWLGSGIPNLALAAATADSHGLSPNKMLWQPTAGAFRAVTSAGKVSVRSTVWSRGRLIVKDTDFSGGSFALTIQDGGGRVRLAGWIDVRTAKQFPNLSAHYASTHFIQQSQLKDMDELEQFLSGGG